MRRALIVALLLTATSSFANFREFTAIPIDPKVEQELARIADEILGQYSGKLTRGHLSMTLVDLSDPSAPRRASFDGEVPYHPASVVKMPYLVYAHHLLERGKLKMSSELERAMRDMIIDSSNDATNFILDVITDTASGSELPERKFRQFVKKRGVVNDFFKPMGYDTNTMGKTVCENVYGRDKQLLGEKRERRNRMTSDSAAAMMLSIVRRRSVSAVRSEQMISLMSRRVAADANVKSDDSNVNDFTGQALPPGSRLWSKPGWTSEVRHDATYVELPNGRKYVFAVFSRGHAADLTLLPEVSKRVVALFE